MSLPEDERIYEAVYEGFYTRLRCEKCGDIFEFEDDVSSGEQVECDLCGAVCEVTGR